MPATVEEGIAQMRVAVQKAVQRLLNVTDAGTYAGGVSPWTIRRFVYDGLLTGYTFPGSRQLFVEKSELDALIDKSRGRRTAAPCQEAK